MKAIGLDIFDKTAGPDRHVAERLRQSYISFAIVSPSNSPHHLSAKLPLLVRAFTTTNSSPLANPPIGTSMDLSMRSRDDVRPFDPRNAARAVFALPCIITWKAFSYSFPQVSPLAIPHLHKHYDDQP